MELKAVPARYEVATQLAKYKDELRSRGENHILMWLVAPQVSNSIREFLDRIGIEYSEIHETEFQRVAERHGVPVRGESPPLIQRAGTLEPAANQKTPRSSKRAVLPTERSREFIKSTDSRTNLTETVSGKWAYRPKHKSPTLPSGTSGEQ